jgi:hypothetical protein
MASTSIIPPISEIGELCSHGVGVPILFPIDVDGIVVVSSLHLSIRFPLKTSTIWVERDISHHDTRLVVQILHETSKLTDNDNVVWELTAGKYRVYGLLRFSDGSGNINPYFSSIVHFYLKHPTGNKSQDRVWCRQRYRLV